MRVLMLSWEYPPHVVGGLGQHVAELTPALSEEGVQIHLITPRWAGGSSQESLGDGMVHRVDPPDPTGLDILTVAQRTNWSLEERGQALMEKAGPFDLIHAHDWLVAFAACALKHQQRVPLVATIHATEHGRCRGNPCGEISAAIHNNEWWLTYEAWRVICCSGFMANEVARIFRTPLDKIDVIPNGVEVRRFDCLEGRDLSRFRQRYALPEEKIVYYVGRLVHEKGVGVLVEAMPRVLRSFPLAKFVVAGTGSQDSELRARADALGLGGKVLFTGFISDEDRDRLFKVADVAVFPSLYEPFGIVALEAMAARTPVVVSEVGGLAEVVEHGETGLRVYPDNPDSLAWGIVHTLTEPYWARVRAEKAYAKVAKEYNWPYIAARTAQVYSRVVRERESVQWNQG